MKLLVFGAVWCPGCIVMEPKIEKIKKDNPELEVIKYDSEEDDIAFNKYSIGDTIPVVILLDKEGNELERLIGEKKKEDIENIIFKYQN